MGRVSPRFSQRQQKLITVHAYLQGLSKSDVVKLGVNTLFDKLNDTQIASMLRAYDKLSDEQKKHPEK